MRTLFVIPASPKLADTVTVLRPIVRDDPKHTKPHFQRLGTHYVDDVVDGLVLDFLRESGSASPRTQSLIQTLAGLIKSVSHGLVGQAFGKLTPERAVELLALLDDRLVERSAGPGLGVPLETSMVLGIERAVAAAEARALADERRELLGTMQSVIDRAIEYHYQKPFAVLELGFLVRKAVDTGYGAIRSGAHSTIEKAISEADEAPLGDLAAFLSRRVHR